MDDEKCREVDEPISGSKSTVDEIAADSLRNFLRTCEVSTLLRGDWMDCERCMGFEKHVGGV